MFGNFLYFIVALLIYATYHPTESPNLPVGDALGLFAGTTVVFAAFTRLMFRRFEKRHVIFRAAYLDHAFNALLTRQSVMAVGIFALEIYGLSLPSFLIDLPVFRTLPTLQAMVFLAIFVGYMAIVWAFAYPSHRRIYAESVTRGEYVRSQITFALPVLLPWLVLSGVGDLIRALPFDGIRRFMDTTAGEILYFLVFLLAISVVGPALIQRFWRCRPLENGPDRFRIEALCRRAGLAYSDILRWPIFGGRMITAGVMGLVSRFRYILVTDALLGMLSTEEIDAVIAHEIGHVKRRHMLFYLLFFVSYMILSYATFDLIVYGIIYVEPLFRFVSRTGLDQVTLLSAFFSLAIIATFLVYFRFVFGYYMRNFERQADIYVYRLFDTARPLISTLEKIARTSGQAPDKPNWHHFSILERIEYLHRCETDRRWITRHDRKVKKGIALFCLVMAVFGGIGYQLNFGEAGRRLNIRFLETVVSRELKDNPDDPKLLATLGDLLYHTGRYAETADAYERALHMDPSNPHVLNNLAWLYATSEAERLRDPQRALLLAERAIAHDDSPHVWDTLAESYYVNGRYAEAVRAEREALNRITTGRSYYEEQLQKFEAAGKSGGGSAQGP